MKLLLTLITLLFFMQSTLNAQEVKLSVASSLTNVLTEIKKVYMDNHPGSKVNLNFASSGALAKQIYKGAGADIYISANPKWMAFLKEQNKMYIRSITPLAYNSLVFAGRQKSIQYISQLTQLSKIGIGSPDSVPAGDYTRTALKKSKLYNKLLSDGKLIFASNVRQALFYAETGTVDGSFIYKTDAIISKKSKIMFTVPHTLYPRVTYLAGITEYGKTNKEADRFMRFLKSRTAKRILRKHGFN